MLQEVPRELTLLSESFQAKVARGDAKWANSGFVGKGYTFDADEMNEDQKIASMQKRAYEIEQGLVDDSVEMLDEDEYDEEERVEGGGGVGAIPVVAPEGSSVSATAIEKVKALAAAVAGGSKTASVDPPVLPIAPVSGPVDTQTALARARALAAQLSTPKPSSSSNVQDPTVKETHFADEVEINDYPPQARKKVTQRMSLDDIAERTGVNVISRGVYVEPGKPLKAGERKLYLLLEGTSEMQVRQARLEIQRLLDEETLKLGSSIATGRYAVV